MLRIVIETNVDDVIDKYKQMKDDMNKKIDLFLERLATIGAQVASHEFATAVYNGVNDVVVSVMRVSETRWELVANGKAVLFIEYGSGIKYGYGHPDPSIFGPSTWSESVGKGHWNDPKGWFWREGGELHHSYGNPPARAMYDATKEIELSIEEVARDVFVW